MFSFFQFGMMFFLPVVILILSCWAKVVIGPYWLGGYDPTYQYLINGLTIVNQGIPNHWDHPGSPLQILIASIIWLLNIGKSFIQIVNQVLSNPEMYLQIIFFVNLSFIIVMLIVFTMYAYLKTKTEIIILIVQIPILFLLYILPGCFISIRPEALLIAIGSVYNLLIIKLFFDNHRFETRNAVLLGIVFGIAIAVKVTIVPIMVIPLVLLSLRNKFLFIFTCVTAFIFSTMPIWSRYEKLFEWLFNLASYTGQYASGDKGFIDWKQYIISWGIMFQHLWGVLFLVIGTSSWGCVKLFRRQMNREEKFLFVISMAIILQFIFVAKHYAIHYLLPGLLLLPVLMFLLIYRFQSFFLKWKKNVFILSIALIFMMIFIISKKNFDLKKITKEKHDQYLLIEEELKQCFVLESYGVVGQSYALIFGDGWRNGLQKYGEVLTQMYPNKMNFNIWDKKIYNLKGEPVFANDLLDMGKCVVFRENSLFDFSKSPYLVAMIKDFNFKEVKALVRSTEKEATLLLMLSQQKIQEGKIEEGRNLMLKAQALYYSGGIIK